MTQQQLSCAVGISQSYVTEIETGRKRSNAETMNKICSVLGLKVVVENDGTKGGAADLVPEFPDFLKPFPKDIATLLIAIRASYETKR